MLTNQIETHHIKSDSLFIEEYTVTEEVLTDQFIMKVNLTLEELNDNLNACRELEGGA